MPDMVSAGWQGRRGGFLGGSTTIAVAYRYDTYGQTLASGGSGGGPDQPYRYQGRLDISPAAAEPLYAAGARYYQPSLGVFTQLDSLAGSVQNPLGLNRYLYAEANPTSLIDPDGHAAMANAGVGAELSPAAMSVVLQQFKQAAAAQAAQRKAAAAAALKQYILSHDSGGQLIGVAQGFAGAGVDALHGVWETGWWAYHLSPVNSAIDHSSYVATRTATDQVVAYTLAHPGDAAGAVWSGLSSPIASDWQSGDAGKAVGRGVFDLATIVVPLTKAAKLAKAAETLGLLRGAAGIERAVGAAGEAGSAAAVNGETAATAAGRAAHAAMEYGEGFQKEFTLPSGARVDAINFQDRIVLELKPNNMRAIYRGLNQVDRYLQELNLEYPGDTPWQGQVVTYGR